MSSSVSCMSAASCRISGAVGSATGAATCCRIGFPIFAMRRMATVCSHSDSGRDDYLPEYLAILDQPHALRGVLQRQHLVDDRLQLTLRDEPHKRLEVVVVEAVGTEHLQLEGQDVAQVLLRIVTGGRAADEYPAAALDAAERGLPGVAAGEVDDDVDA